MWHSMWSRLITDDSESYFTFSLPFRSHLPHLTHCLSCLLTVPSHPAAFHLVCLCVGMRAKLQPPPIKPALHPLIIAGDGALSGLVAVNGTSHACCLVLPSSERVMMVRNGIVPPLTASHPQAGCVTLPSHICHIKVGAPPVMPMGNTSPWLSSSLSAITSTPSRTLHTYYSITSTGSLTAAILTAHTPLNVM